MAVRILAVDDNAINLKVVSITLQHAGYEMYTADSGPKALAMAGSIHPEVVLLDVAMPEMDGFEACRQLRADPVTANMIIVMLTANDTLEEKVRGYDSGADDYIIKPFQPAELQARIKFLLRRAPFLPGKADSSLNPGKVIGVFSLRGGVGVSTLATNLACGLAQLWGHSVALVDLSLAAGQSVLMLNLSLRNTWADLARMPIDQVNLEAVRRVLIHHSSGVSVLAAPRLPADSDQVSPELVNKVLEILKELYNYIVLDLSHDFRATTVSGLTASDEIMVLLAPEMASIRSVGCALEVFDQLGYKNKRIDLVMNTIFEQRGLAKREIEMTLRHPIQWVIPFASEAMVTAINQGIPPVYSANTQPGALFEDMSFKLSREEDNQQPPANPSDAWKRVQDRKEVHFSTKH